MVRSELIHTYHSRVIFTNYQIWDDSFLQTQLYSLRKNVTDETLICFVNTHSHGTKHPCFEPFSFLLNIVLKFHTRSSSQALLKYQLTTSLTSILNNKLYIIIHSCVMKVGFCYLIGLFVIILHKVLKNIKYMKKYNIILYKYNIKNGIAFNPSLKNIIIQALNVMPVITVNFLFLVKKIDMASVISVKS